MCEHTASLFIIIKIKALSFPKTTPFGFLLNFYYNTRMIPQDKIKYTQELNNSISYLQSLGYSKIKADIEGYESPKSYLKKGSKIEVTPDIVAEKEGRKHIFDLSLKSQKPRLLKSKWIFLNTLSQLKSYRFRLITTRGHYKFTNETIDDINLNTVKLIKI